MFWSCNKMWEHWEILWSFSKVAQRSLLSAKHHHMFRIPHWTGQWSVIRKRVFGALSLPRMIWVWMTHYSGRSSHPGVCSDLRNEKNYKTGSWKWIFLTDAPIMKVGAFRGILYTFCCYAIATYSSCQSHFLALNGRKLAIFVQKRSIKCCKWHIKPWYCVSRDLSPDSLLLLLLHDEGNENLLCALV